MSGFIILASRFVQTKTIVENLGVAIPLEVFNTNSTSCVSQSIDYKAQNLLESV